MHTTTAAIEAAKQVAAFFAGVAGVQQVYLFGSISREGEGHDIDMVLIVDEPMAEAFIASQEGHDTPYTFSEDRGDAVERILGVDLRVVEQAAGDWCVDIFLFPPNWKDDLDELQMSLRHNDPNFMVKVARDARRFNPILGCFE